MRRQRGNHPNWAISSVIPPACSSIPRFAQERSDRLPYGAPKRMAKWRRTGDNLVEGARPSGRRRPTSGRISSPVATSQPCTTNAVRGRPQVMSQHRPIAAASRLPAPSAAQAPAGACSRSPSGAPQAQDAASGPQLSARVNRPLGEPCTLRGRRS